MKKATLIFLFIITFLLIGGKEVSAVSIKAGEQIDVRELEVTVLVVTDAPSVTFQVRDLAGKIVLGPTKFNDADPVNGAEDGIVRVQFSTTTLKKDEVYELYGTNTPNKQGDEVVSQQFRTLKIDTIAKPKGKWYYTTSFDINAYKTNVNGSYFSFPSQPACQLAWQEYLDRIAQEESISAGNGVERKFTECFESETFPTEAEFLSRLKPMSVFKTSVKLYYYLYVSSIGTTSPGYKTEGDCKTAENADRARGFRIVAGCKEYDARPDAPAYDTPTIIERQSTPFEETYTLLAPFGGITEIDESNEGNAIGNYLNTIFKIAIGIAGALAVIMLIINGITYMGDDSVFGKTEAKGRMVSAIGGLLLAIGAYAILNTINPDLVGGQLNVGQVNIQLDGDTNAPVSVNKADAVSTGLICNGGGKTSIGTIAESFKGRMTYQMGAKGIVGPLANGKPTIKLDCSGFVNYVLSCAGVNNSSVNTGTYGMFTGAERITSISGNSVNGKELQPGDLLGWKQGDLGNKYGGYGHVIIYLGNGRFAESHGGTGKQPGNAYLSFSISRYKNDLKFIRRLP